MLAFCPSFWSLNLQNSHLVSESMPQGGKEMMAGRLRDMLGRLNVRDQNYLGLISDFSQSGEFLSTYGKIIGEDSLSGTNCYKFTHRCILYDGKKSYYTAPKRYYLAIAVPTAVIHLVTQQ
jgi:hypothetical protein